jgi:hypothetical protein
MLDLKTKADLQQLVDEGLEESLTLDYKDSRALTRDGKGPDEMCKDVTALANSAGGQLVYGIEEDKASKKPSRVDDGVADPKITREWIEQILNSRVQPRLSGVTTTRIDMENGQFGYVVTVPPTRTGPHQAPDQKYYRRFDLQSVPMHDYEIKDIMRRASTPHLEVLASFWGTGSPTEATMTRSSEESRSEPIRIEFIVSNKANQPAEYAVMLVRLDINLKFTGPEHFEVGSVDIIDQHVYQTFARNLGFPAHPPLFKENPESGGWLEIIVQDPKNRVAKFAIIIDILTPGYSRRTRWFIQQVDMRLSLYEDTSYSPPGHTRTDEASA